MILRSLPELRDLQAARFQGSLPLKYAPHREAGESVAASAGSLQSDLENSNSEGHAHCKCKTPGFESVLSLPTSRPLKKQPKKLRKPFTFPFSWIFFS